MFQIYLFAIFGVLVFSLNDPARYGTVASAMLTLFQVSTLSRWTGIAYTSYYGCGNYRGDGDYYGHERDESFVFHTIDDEAVAPSDHGGASMFRTNFGDCQGFRCYKEAPSPSLVFAFYSIYIVLTSFVIMSLFISVISSGMFIAFNEMKLEKQRLEYKRRLEANSDRVANNSRRARRKSKKKRKKETSALKDKIDHALEDVHFSDRPVGSWNILRHRVTVTCMEYRGQGWFTGLITFTILVVAVTTGMDTDLLAHCERIAAKQALGELERGSDDGGGEARHDDAGPEACQGVPAWSLAVSVIGQIIFTFEIAVKMLAEGNNPIRYFSDDENGIWYACSTFWHYSNAVPHSPQKYLLLINVPCLCITVLLFGGWLLPGTPSTL